MKMAHNGETVFVIYMFRCNVVQCNAKKFFLLDDAQKN